jgi:hypothetical protein
VRRRQRGWRSVVVVCTTIAAVALSLAGNPAGSSPARRPRVHAGGAGLDQPSGPPRTQPIPWLTRPGSAIRARHTSPQAQTSPFSPLAPTVLPPGAFDGVPDLVLTSPADPTGALGITNHVAAVNVHVGTFDRAGVPAFEPKRLRSLDPQLPGGATDFDPKVVYDPYDGVFLVAFVSATATKSFISIVVIPEGEEDDDTQANWCTLHMAGDQVPGGPSLFADYPMLGFTADRVTITTNQFDLGLPPAQQFRFVQVVSIRKVHLYDCAVDPVPIKVFSRKQTRDPDGSKAFTIVPAISAGGGPTAQFMVSLDANGSTGKLIVWRLRASGGVLRLVRAEVDSGRMTLPPYGLQCEGTIGGPNTWWDTGDLRLTSAFWDADLGRLYTATSVQGNRGGGDIESLVRWWEVHPTFTLARSNVTRKGTVGAAGRDAAWPSVATDTDGNLWIGFARAGLTECLSAYAAVVRPGAKVGTQALVSTGEDRYEYSRGQPERWGDYTAIARDPVTGTSVAVYGAIPILDGTGTTSNVWQQVIAALEDV